MIGEFGGGKKEKKRTNVVNEFGKALKNCLCVLRSRETTNVAKRSSVSWSRE